jgi:hypothetical protein
MSNRRLARWWPIALFVTGATLLAACTGSGSSSQPPANSSSKPVNGGSVTYAVPFAQSWMLPIWNVGTGIANYDTLRHGCRSTGSVTTATPR